ncbi:hypothetical protein CYMTET_48767, partial [Cymbomonas tetramitiformis]
APYISLLPSWFPGIPLFYGRDALQALQYPPVAAQVTKRAKFLHQFSTQLAAVRSTRRCPFRTDVDANALGWALSAVSSRAFRVNGPDHPAAMLPLIDMCNHSFDNNCTTIPDGEGGIKLVALADIAADTALLINYGALANDFLLLDYGFIDASNPHDYISLRFDEGLIEMARLLAGQMDAAFTGMESVAAWKKERLVQLRLLGPEADLEVRVGGHQLVDGRFLAALRILYATDAAELESVPFRDLGNTEPHISQMLCKEKEVQVFTTLVGAATHGLSGFPSTLEADRAALPTLKQSASDSVAERNVALALEFRIAKKICIKTAIQKFVNIATIRQQLP